jgi:hypothetical protein
MINSTNHRKKLHIISGNVSKNIEYYPFPHEKSRKITDEGKIE